MSLQPPKACTHALSHTPAHTPGRALGGHVSLARQRGAHTPHPSRGPSPPGDAPRSPPAETHWTEGWRGAGGARRGPSPGPQGPRGGRARGARRTGLRGGAARGPGAGRGGGGGGVSRREVGAGRGAGAGALLLTGTAGRRAGLRAARRARRTCSRRHAWLPGRLCGRRRKGRQGPAAALGLGGDLLSLLPPRAPSPRPLSLHFFTLVSSRAWFSRLSPEPPSPPHSEEASASHKPFVLAPLRSGCDLPTREARSPGAAWSLPQLPAARLGRR